MSETRVVSPDLIDVYEDGKVSRYQFDWSLKDYKQVAVFDEQKVPREIEPYYRLVYKNVRRNCLGIDA